MGIFSSKYKYNNREYKIPKGILIRFRLFLLIFIIIFVSFLSILFSVYIITIPFIYIIILGICYLMRHFLNSKYGVGHDIKPKLYEKRSWVYTHIYPLNIYQVCRDMLFANIMYEKKNK